jgi:hypothetical protein
MAVWYSLCSFGMYSFPVLVCLDLEKSGNPDVSQPTKASSGTCKTNPTIVSYNASAVKIYNATSSLERFIKYFYQVHTTTMHIKP